MTKQGSFIRLLAGASIAAAGLGLITFAPKIYSGVFHLSIDNRRSVHPLETLKNPAYLSPYIAEAISVSSNSASTSLFRLPSCRYSLDVDSYSIYRCQVTATTYGLGKVLELPITLSRLWVPRYSHDDGRVFGAVTRTYDENRLGQLAYGNLLGESGGQHIFLNIPAETRPYLYTKNFSLGLFLLAAGLSAFISSFVSIKLMRHISPKLVIILATQFALVLASLELASRIFFVGIPDAYPHLHYSRFLVLLVESWQKALYKHSLTGIPAGSSLRDFAWRKTYSEFNLDQPHGGRREEYLGEKLVFKQPCGAMQICWSPINNKAINIDDSGYQYSTACRIRKPENIEILVVGGSVAEGAHASMTSTTWWNIFSQSFSRLSARSVCTGVLALGGAESDWELEAVKVHLLKHKPKIVLLMDGANDIIKRHSSDPRLLQRHANKYIVNTASIASLVARKGGLLVQALQPVLFDKSQLSKTEELLLVGYLPTAGHDITAPRRVFKPYFDQIASAGALADWNDPSHIFIDMRSTFNLDGRTLFGDIWHFQDPAHRILGHSLAMRVSQRMRALEFSF